MGDTEQDDIEIKRLSPTNTPKDIVVEYKTSNRRTALKIGLYVSIGLNIVFAVLFVVVFIMLNNMNAKLSRLDQHITKGNLTILNSMGTKDAIRDRKVSTSKDFTGPTSPQKPSVIFGLYVFDQS